METHYSEIILDLENDLSRMKEVSENAPEQLEYAIGLCKVALDRMRKLVIQCSIEHSLIGYSQSDFEKI